MNKQLKCFYLFYFIYYISMGVYFPFANVHYEGLGLNGTQIGTINSIGLIFAMVSTPIFGSISDRSNKRKTILTILMLATAIAVFFWRKQTLFLPLIIMSTIFTIFRSSINPLIDSQAVGFCSKYLLDFGKIRAIGSFGYIFGGFVIAAIASKLNFQGPYVTIYIFSLIIAIGIIYFLPKFNNKPNIENKENIKEKSNLLKDTKKLLKNRNYIFIVILMLFTNLVMDSAGGYIGNHIVKSLNGTQATISLYTLIAAFPEVFFIMIVGNLAVKFGYKYIYLFAIITQIIRCITYSFTNNLILFLVITIVHTIMTGAGAVLNLNYINRVVDSSILATALSLYTATYLIVQAIYTQVFGAIYQNFGSQYVFLATAIITSVGFVIVFKTKRFNECSLHTIN